MTERQKYLRLLSIVIEDLPTSAIDALIRDGYKSSASMLNNVRIGRSHHLGHLVALVRVGLPKFFYSGRTVAGSHARSVARVMETRAPYHASPAPKGPRNLTVPLAAWLRTQGFTATEQHHATLATVAAHWIGPMNDRYEFTYTWTAGPVPDATCQLQVYWLGLPEKLFTAQRVRRLKEVRLLLLGNVRYHNARLLSRTITVR